MLVVSLHTGLDEIRAKLSDFGITRNALKTAQMSQKGTPLFEAPEVCTFFFGSFFIFILKVISNKPYGKKCDVYSFGLTIWSIFAERFPFSDAKSSAMLLKKIKRGERPPLDENCKINHIIQK